MKKYIIFLLLFSLSFLSGCSIDYTGYYKEHPDIKPNLGQETKPDISDSTNNEDNPAIPSIPEEKKLTSEIIDDGIKEYPTNYQIKLTTYDKVYKLEKNNYKIYSSYYSKDSDTVYIAYDNIANPTQTLDSRDLAIIEEHLLFYFQSDVNKSEYNNYLKAIRIYPDYASSACRLDNDSSYNRILGCANYNSKEAEINLNNLNSLDVFFNSSNNNSEPRRDTFAHEYGHVSTYYHMILKGDGDYENYLKLRLKEDYNTIYPNGLLHRYDSDFTYNKQPTEILADDYVELFYNIASKNPKDKNIYTLQYSDYRNSLNNVLNNGSKDHGYHYQYLKDNPELLKEVKNYYNTFILNKPIEYETPIVVNVNTYEYYSTINDILINNKTNINLVNKEIIVLGEITLDGLTYYRTILANCLSKISKDDIIYDGLRQHPINIGYILKNNTNLLDNKNVIKYDKTNGQDADPNIFLIISDGKSEAYIAPYYDYSYFVSYQGAIKLYDYVNDYFAIVNLDK